jgi:hypothetical protein
MTTTTVVLTVIGLLLSLISIFAIYYGPIAALKMQRTFDATKQDRQRKEEIFRAIWVTRSTPMHFRHVEALNLIDLDFVNQPAVIAAWNLYHDHLSLRPQPDNWGDRRVELLTDLLYEIGKSLGYNYDKVLLMRHWYRPELHGMLDEMELAWRTGFAAMMKGEHALPVRLVEQGPMRPQPPAPAQTPILPPRER